MDQRHQDTGSGPLPLSFLSSPDLVGREAEFAESYYRLAKLYFDKSDLEKAEENFIKALELCEKLDTQRLVIKIYGFLIRITSERLEVEKTENYIRCAEEISNVENESGVFPSGEYFYNIGLIKTYRGLDREAVHFFQRAILESKKDNEPAILTKSLYSQALAYFHLKEYESVLSILGHLSEVLQIVQKGYIRGVMHLLYGNTYTELGKYDNAFESYSMANRMLMGQSCWNLHSYILLKQGVVFKKKGEFEKSLFYFEMAFSTIDRRVFKRLGKLIENEISDVNDNNVDLYLDYEGRMVFDRNLGAIDFKHRFILLEILFLLAQNPGTPFCKEELVRCVWKDEYNPLIHDKLIYTSVSRLRKLISPKGQKKYIIRGKDGYSFNKHIKTRFHRGQEWGCSVLANVDLNSPV